MTKESNPLWTMPYLLSIGPDESVRSRHRSVLAASDLPPAALGGRVLEAVVVVEGPVVLVDAGLAEEDVRLL